MEEKYCLIPVKVANLKGNVALEQLIARYTKLFPHHIGQIVVKVPFQQSESLMELHRKALVTLFGKRIYFFTKFHYNRHALKTSCIQFRCTTHKGCK